MINIKIDLSEIRSESAPLYCKYDLQINPQPAFIELDLETGNVTADYSGEIGGGVPVSVWNGIWRRYSVPAYISGECLAEILEDEEVVALLNRIHEGSDVEWNGNNYVGVLNDDAQDAEESLVNLLEHWHIQGNVWEAKEWLFSCSKLWDHWNDQPLSEAVAELKSDAESDNAHIDGDIEETLISEALDCWISNGSYGPQDLTDTQIRELHTRGEIDLDDLDEDQREAAVRAGLISE